MTDDRATYDQLREGLERVAEEMGRLRAGMADLTARMFLVEHAVTDLLAEMRGARRDLGRGEAATRDFRLPALDSRRRGASGESGP